MNERELFLDWHFNDWKSNNANADSMEFSKKLYDRVYSHDNTSYVRELEFKAWQASANREGYKLVPVEPTVNMMHIGDNVIYYEYDDEKYTSYSVYKAMIGEYTK